MVGWINRIYTRLVNGDSESAVSSYTPSPQKNISTRLKGSAMVLILDGSSEHIKQIK